jgi:DNA-binding GntR family transcriptional regulator
MTDSLRPAQAVATLTEQAYASLKRGILSGVLKPGQSYTLDALSEQLGVSRTPIREALRALSAEGWITYTARGAARVVHPSASDAMEYFEIREALECYAIRKVSWDDAPDLLDRLTAVLDQQSAALTNQDWAGLMHAARRFHRELVVATGNTRLIEYYDRMTEYLELFGHTALTAGHTPEAMVTEHQDLVDLLRANRIEQAANALLEHIGQSAQAYAQSPQGEGR